VSKSLIQMHLPTRKEKHKLYRNRPLRHYERAGAAPPPAPELPNNVVVPELNFISCDSWNRPGSRVGWIPPGVYVDSRPLKRPPNGNARSSVTVCEKILNNALGERPISDSARTLRQNITQHGSHTVDDHVWHPFKDQGGGQNSRAAHERSANGQVLEDPHPARHRHQVWSNT
jgi:hypothetical protein